MGRIFRRRDAGLSGGWRSGLEKVISVELKRKNVAFWYEKLTIPFLQPAKPRKYTPDFYILANGIVLETKGRFITEDRKKHLLVQEQHPDIDLRFVFSRSASRISKQSQTTYAKWCETHGFQYADKSVPEAWLREPPNKRSLAAIKALLH